MTKDNNVAENQRIVFDNLKKMAKKQIMYMNASIICTAVVFTVVIFSAQYHSNISPYIIMFVSLMLIPAHIFNKKSMKDVFEDKRLFYLFYRTRATMIKYLEDRSPENTRLVMMDLKKLVRGLNWWMNRKAPPEQIKQIEFCIDSVNQVILPLIKNKKLKELQSLTNPLSQMIDRSFENGMDNSICNEFNNIISNLHEVKKINGITALWQKHKHHIVLTLYAISIPTYMIFMHYNPSLQSEIGSDLALLSTIPFIITIYKRMKRTDPV